MTGGSAGAPGGAGAVAGAAGTTSSIGGTSTAASGGAPTGGATTTGGGSGGAPGGGSGGGSTAGGGMGAIAGASDGGAGGISNPGGAGAGAGRDAGAGGAAGTGAGGRAGAPVAGSGGGGAIDPAVAKFSFFVASYPSLQQLSGKAEGFGGDLRFGKADGLSGADEICRQVAELGMPGAGQKQWRAFLSAVSGPNGAAVNARDRIGAGPWYDRMGRLVANNLDTLLAGERPPGDASIINDLPNEHGEPNHYVGPNGLQDTVVDNHDTLTGSDTAGRLRASSAADTCNDWTSTTATGRPWIGHSWPRSNTNGRHWTSDHQVPGCAAGIDRTLGGSGQGSCVGCSGGYGGFYCFALP